MKGLLTFFTCLVLLLASCTRLGSRCIDLGQVHTGVEITSPPVVYRVDGRYYVQGVQACFEHHSALIMKNIKDHGGEYVRIPGSEGQVLYHEIVQMNDGLYHFADEADWKMKLPGQAARIFFSPSTGLPHGISDKHTETTAHALYAYPMAAVAFVGVDVPSMLLYTAAGILMIPYVLVKFYVD